MGKQQVKQCSDYQYLRGEKEKGTETICKGKKWLNFPNKAIWSFAI